MRGDRERRPAIAREVAPERNIGTMTQEPTDLRPSGPNIVCPNCSAVQPFSTASCTSCGENLHRQASPSSESSPLASPSFEYRRGSVSPEKVPFWRKGRFVLIAVVVGLIGLCGYAAVGLLESISHADEAEATISSFLQYVSDGDSASAYALLSEELKVEVSVGDFATQVQDVPGFSRFQGLETREWEATASPGSKSTFHYIGRITYLDGDHGAVEAYLLREAGQWKIREISVDR